MCGIAGEAGKLIQQGNTSQVRKMVQALTHRGPDEQVYIPTKAYEKGDTPSIGVNLGMCRLSIIDRDHGSQPFGRKCQVFFNGEIYNHREISESLAAHDEWVCQTECDTEVIAGVYETDGVEGISRLHGMFAIAIWDKAKQQLHLVRDRIGKKPLYYYHDHNTGTFLFASEIKGILANPLYRKQVNLAGIYQYLCMQYVPEPETAFHGIKCVPPGSILTFDPVRNTLDCQSYWALRKRGRAWGYELTSKKWIAAVHSKVEEAVHIRLESEVPLGVYLSGGIDSAIVTAVASQFSKEPLHTFTMGFMEDEYNEIPAAQHVADMYKTDHHTEIVKSVELRNVAYEVARQYDQPFGDCSAVPTMLLARLSKKHITVALCGDGGDEVFGGYPRYWMCKDFNEYWKFMCVFPPDIRDALWKRCDGQPICHPDWPQPSDYVMAEHMPTIDAAGAMISDCHTYLLNDIIVKMERASMAASVEARCPFLDHDVLQLGVDMPTAEKIQNGTGKMALRRAFGPVLPQQIMSLPKRGFSVPVNEWFRSTEGVMLMSETIMRPGAWDGLPIKPEVVGNLVTWHLSGDRAIGHGLWLLVQLAIWYREHYE